MTINSPGNNVNIQFLSKFEEAKYQFYWVFGIQTCPNFHFSQFLLVKFEFSLYLRSQNLNWAQNCPYFSYLIFEKAFLGLEHCTLHQRRPQMKVTYVLTHIFPFGDKKYLTYASPRVVSNFFAFGTNADSSFKWGSALMFTSKWRAKSCSWKKK